MTSILTLKNPVSSVTEDILTRINLVCAKQNIPYFIAGATAREILIHHVHGKNIGRRTRDIDIAIFVNEWQVFDELKENLQELGAQGVRNNVHRMEWGRTELDIIPFGGVAQENQIAWPPDRTFIMSVDGFAEAFAHVITVRLGNGTSIPFCSLPGLGLLKLFAWRDRGQANSKDAEDLYKIISDYGCIENARIYESPVNGDALDWDLLRMGAFLLGYDIALLSLPALIEELQELNKEKLTDSIIQRFAAERAREIEQIMDDFWSGVLGT